jgi:hypothetical protein
MSRPVSLICTLCPWFVHARLQKPGEVARYVLVVLLGHHYITQMSTDIAACTAPSRYAIYGLVSVHVTWVRARPCYVRSISAFGGGTLIMACARGCHWLRPRLSTDRKHGKGHVLINDVKTLSRAYVTALFTTFT